MDQQVYQCLPGCSEHGTYDLETATCICDRHWTGHDCSQGKLMGGLCSFEWALSASVWPLVNCHVTLRIIIRTLMQETLTARGIFTAPRVFIIKGRGRGDEEAPFHDKFMST